MPGLHLLLLLHMLPRKGEAAKQKMKMVCRQLLTQEDECDGDQAEAKQLPPQEDECERQCMLSGCMCKKVKVTRTLKLESSNSIYSICTYY